MSRCDRAFEGDEGLAGVLPARAWGLAGVVVTALVGLRFNVGLLGWVALVPWLLYARRCAGARGWLALAGFVQLGTFLQILKMVSAPLPWPFALLYSAPLALVTTLVLFAFESLRRRLGDGWGLALLPALVVVSEWSGPSLSELGSWGALAYTQVDNLPLLQLTALFGLWGVSALLAAVSALVALVLADARPGRWSPAALWIFGLVLAAHAYGSIRLFAPLPGPVVRVGTVVTDVVLGGPELPPPDELVRATDVLFARSQEAARAGAQVVVWNEGATAVTAAEEPELVARAHALAAAEGVDLIVAYVVPLDGMRRFENKYVWVTPEGPIETYFKHHPVPGEGSVAGEAPLVVHTRPYGRAAGAICYDYDFPAMGRAHAALGAELVLVPSSDWPGIDPYHTQMASIRGIEGGFAVARSVRAATSAVFDAHGVSRGRASELEGTRMMVAPVPVGEVVTLYRTIGDLLPLAAGVVLLAAFARVARRRP